MKQDTIQDLRAFSAKVYVKELLGRSFLSPSLQKQYWMAFDYRRKKSINIKFKRVCQNAKRRIENL